MARPERHDVDYFPFYVKDGKTLFVLESKFGCKGIGFFTNVMRFLCKTPDHHFCIAGEQDRLYFFATAKCDETEGQEMLNIMATTGKIHPDLWRDYQVIASPDLLNSLSDAYKNRKNNIITIDQIVVSYQKSGITYPQKPVTTPDNPQTKLKETKLNNNSKKTPWPDDLILTDHLRKLALKYIPKDKIDIEWEVFKAYSLRENKQYVDWQQAWTTRYINYAKFNKEDKPTGPPLRSIKDNMREDA